MTGSPLNLGASGNPLEGFYAANYAVVVIKAGAGEFSSFLGDAVITDEGNHNMYHIFWDSSVGAFSTSVIGQFPNQPEDGIFLTSAILNPVPEPETYAMFMVGLVLMAFMARRRKQKQAACTHSTNIHIYPASAGFVFGCSNMWKTVIGTNSTLCQIKSA